MSFRSAGFGFLGFRFGSGFSGILMQVMTVCFLVYGFGLSCFCGFVYLMLMGWLVVVFWGAVMLVIFPEFGFVLGFPGFLLVGL